MVSIQHWRAVDTLNIDTGTHLENQVTGILSPIHLHKTIMKNITGLHGVVLVSQLAKELEVGVEDLLPSFEVLRDLKLIEIDEASEVVHLTNNGRLANLENLC